ncbi:MAG: T9SS type A sorting domain-containing protein [Crocinitomicaceae bacterium]
MRKLLFALALLTGTLASTQTFQKVGSASLPVASSVIEMDFDIENGVPYVFYVTSSTNKGTVKKWNGLVWETIGTPDFTSSDPFELDIEVEGTTVYVAYKYVQGTGATSDRLGVHRYEGASWIGMSSYFYPGLGSGPMTCDHNRPFDLEVEYSNVRLAFFDEYQQNKFKYTTWNNTLGYFNEVAASLDLNDDDNDIVINELKVHLDADGYEYYACSVVGMGFESLLFRRSGASWTSYGDIWGAASSESNKGVDMVSYWDSNGDYIEVSVGAIRDDASKKLYHANFYSDPTPGWQMNYTQINSTTNVSEFNMAANSSETFYFYNQSSVAYLDEVDHFGNNVSTYTNFGISGTKSNLRVDTRYDGRPVLAFLVSGNLWVVEEWSPVSFTMTDPETCSGQTEVFTSHVTVSSSNLDNSDLSWIVTPDQPNVMHSSTITGFYPDFDLNLGTYYQSSNVTVELDVQIFDETNALNYDNQFYPLVKANDSIINYFTASQICRNNGPISFMDYVYPLGGIFSGTIASSGNFSPILAGVGAHTISYTTYNAISGCSNSLNIPIQVVGAPVATVVATNASCNDSTGTATVAAAGGASPYTYYWNTGADSVNLADLPAGQYFVTVTDNNGCMATGVGNVGNTSINLLANVSTLNCATDNNGSIDLTVAGVGPFDILWSNGYGTEDITGLVAGMYDVTVTDANGCTATETYEVTAPDEMQVTASISNASCGATDGQIALAVSGGNGTYTYQWFDEDNNAVGSNSPTFSNAFGGFYTCQISDGNGCGYTWTGVVNDNGAPVVTINSVTNASCSNDGAIDMSYTASAALDHIIWSNGAGTEDISGLAPGNYAVWVVDVNGCTGMGNVTVNPQLPATPQICVVTVDSITTSNVVVWEKAVTSNISHYNIYREGSQAGQYLKIDSVLYSEDSEFNDLVASPMVRSWRYKISAVDNCGNESAKSAYHKTIHATINLGLGSNINILWDSYEGLSYSSWSCWRYTTTNGFELIWTNSSNVFSYTDTPPSTQGLDYVIGFPLGTTCSSSLLKAQDYNGTRSNRSAGVFNGSGLGIEENEATDFDVVVFPNPSSGNFQVRLTGTANGTFDYQIIDITGKIIEDGNQTQRSFDMDLTNLESGIYYLNIINNGLVKTSKLIIQ